MGRKGLREEEWENVWKACSGKEMSRMGVQIPT